VVVTVITTFKIDAYTKSIKEFITN